MASICTLSILKYSRSLSLVALLSVFLSHLPTYTLFAFFFLSLSLSIFSIILGPLSCFFFFPLIPSHSFTSTSLSLCFESNILACTIGLSVESEAFLSFLVHLAQRKERLKEVRAHLRYC